jgi:aminoglycoside 6'-N-acetyltransferase I
MDDIVIRTLGAGDLELICTTADDLFDHPVDRAQAAAFLGDPAHVMVAAIGAGDIVGFASGTVLLHPDKQPAFFVNEVGTRDAWQRRGIARALMARLMEEARAKGCKGIWLGTEPDNTAALGLYRSLGGDEVAFVGFGWDDAL